MDTEIQDFEEWYDSQGYGPEHKMILAMAWDAGVDNAASHFAESEGTDCDVGKRLKSS